jgi:hypothetical protein
MSDEHRAALQRNLRIGGNLHVKPDENVAVKIAATTTGDADLSPVQRKHKERREAEGRNVKGAFDKLKARVQAALANGGVEMSKASKLTGASMVVKAVKVEHPALAKTIATKIEEARASLGKAMAVGGDAPVGATSLEAGYNSDSATMVGGDALRAQSLDKRVQATVVPSTSDEITKAASAALTAGSITGAEANHIATHIALNGGKRCDADLLKKIGCVK